MNFGGNKTGESSDTSQAHALIGVLTDLARELRGPSTSLLDISLSSRLERDLGIDSLGRTELVMRIERAFKVRLSISVMSEANTVGDLLEALQKAASEVGSLVAHSVAEIPQVAALAVAPAAEANTLLEALEWHVARNPNRPHVTILQDENIVFATITYAQLAKSARDVAAGLIASDVAPGDRIALMLPTGADFFVAFFGTLYAGAVPVPIYPPMQLAQLEDYLAGRQQFCAMRRPKYS